MRSHTQSVVIELNRRITGCIYYKPINSDISVLIFCNKTGGTIKGDIKNTENVYRFNAKIYVTNSTHSKLTTGSFYLACF